jgi:hypothetical protein
LPKYYKIKQALLGDKKFREGEKQMKIIKRSGSEVVFDIEKIVAAIIKAN